jgi:hypothetical protein
MLIPLFLATFLLVGQAEKVPQSGIIVGTVKPPQPMAISAPVQVVLLSPEYVELWEADVQKRLDTYWERYKSAFAQKKEYFTEISRMAYLDSIQFVVNRMRRDLPEGFSAFVQFSSTEGRFEFKGIPLGRYKVFAVGRADGQQLIWQDSVELSDPLPQFIDLHTPIP